jgi:hypothetical protein
MFAVAALVTTFVAIAQDEPSPHVSFSVSKARYLSTESPQGSIEIANTTARDLAYSSLSVTFLIRDAAGHEREDRWIKSITRIPPTTWIPSGETRTFSVIPPKCDVISDSCIERVAIKLGLGARNGPGMTVVTNERSYAFDPDPTATFQVDGLRNNRPLFITQGEARDVVPADRARVEVRFTGAAPADFNNVVDRLANRHALRVVEVSDQDDSRSFDLVSNTPGLRPPEGATIDAVSDDIRHEYGSRVDVISKSFVPDNYFGFQQAFNNAHADASSSADRLARFIGAYPLSFASNLSGDGDKIQIKPKSDDENPDAPFIPSRDLLFDPSVLKSEESAFPTLLDVLVRSADPSLGARAVSATTSTLGASSALEYNADGLSGIAPLSIRATLAADRPQVFAIAATTKENSERHGLEHDAVALTLARDRANALALQLGVAPGAISLIAQYEPLKWSENRTLIGFGVGLTILDEPSAKWHHMATPSPTATPTIRGLVPFPSPQPVPVATRFSGTTPSPRPDMVPIEVPEASTTLIAQGDVPTSLVADALRVSIAFERGDRTPDDSHLQNLPDPATIERLLRSQSSVADVAAQTISYAPFPVGYQIIVRAHNAATVKTLIAMIRSKYAPFHAAAKYGVSPVLSDCADWVLKAQATSAQEALRRAASDARQNGRRLRRLLLAAAYPPETGDFCLGSAESNALDWARDDALHLPADQMARTVSLHVAVKLTFRTYAK